MKIRVLCVLAGFALQVLPCRSQDADDNDDADMHVFGVGYKIKI